MERRKLELAAKQEVLDEAFDLALKKLCDLPEAEYIKLLTDLAVEASTNGKEQLVFSQKDRAQVGKKVVVAVNKAVANGQLTLSEETRPMKGGFILVDGDVEINCAFETLVRLQREKLEKEVSKALFD
jgi:V/A-type H+-transporting ATPase subunit E